MSSFNKISLKQLQKANSFDVSNSLIVETPTGTFSIPGRFFVLQDDNVSFSSSLYSTSALYLYENSTINNLLTSVSAAINTTIFSNVTGLSTTVDGQLSRILYKAGQVKIERGNVTSNTVSINVSSGFILSAFDINLNFATHIVPNTAVFFTTVSANPNNTIFNRISAIGPSDRPVVAFPILIGNMPNYTLQVQLSEPSLSAVIISYNFRKPI